MAKRVAFFIGQLLHEYQLDAIRGVVNEVEKRDYILEVFSNFGTYGENFLHAEGEKNIMNLPYLDEYDGIIVAPDTFDIAGMYESLSEKILKEANCPVVSLRFEDPNFYNVIIDDVSAMEMMVEHLVVEHSMKRVCFMTGRMDMADARRRLSGYRNAMAKHDLLVTDHMIFEGDYWRGKGKEAVDWFLSGGEYPEAIVCANDYMAISVCDELRRRGIRVPEEICVTGFDHIDEARYYNPSLTSIAVQSEVLGQTAVEILADLFEGKELEQCTYVPVTIGYGASCGCPYDNIEDSVKELYAEKQYSQNAIMQTAYLNVDMESCNDLMDLIQAAYKYSHMFDYENIYICQCVRTVSADDELEDKEHYTDEIELTAMMHKVKGYKTCGEKFSRREILPEKYRSGKGTLFCYPLHYKNDCMGYLVIETAQPENLRYFFITWLLALSNYLDKVRIYVENNKLMQFRQQSMLDALTELLNRREFERIVQRKYDEARLIQKGFFVISCDMDGLKIINDTYGHIEGDRALSALGKILKSVEHSGIHCARVGGDEFSICYETMQKADVLKLITNIRSLIESYNADSKKPYEISASIGYAYCNGKSSLVSCLKKADDSMYREKATKKMSRMNQMREGKI